MFCPACGTQNDAGAAYCVRCGARMAGDGPPAVGTSAAYAAGLPIERPALYAGFWKRFIALVIDWLILSCFFFVMALALGFEWTSIDGDTIKTTRESMAVSLAQLLVPWLYWAAMESSARQATFGKIALGIRVVDLQGRRISFLRASGRFFGKFVSSFILGIGYLIAAFTSRKQALHDLMAGCLVVNRGYAPQSMGAATAPSRRGLGTMALLVIGGVLLLIVCGVIASIGLPAFRDYQVRAKVNRLASAGTDATRAINAQFERTQTLPDTLDARFTGNDDVASIVFDKATRTVKVTANFTPLEGKALLYIASPPGDAPRIVWRCASADIPERYLPQRCRSQVTRL